MSARHSPRRNRLEGDAQLPPPQADRHDPALSVDHRHHDHHRVSDVLADHDLVQGPGRHATANPPVIIPTRFTLDNYVNAFKTAGVPRAFANRSSSPSAATFFTTFLGSMAAYALAKSYLAYAIRRGLMIWILITRIFPPVTTAIPYYVIVRNCISATPTSP